MNLINGVYIIHFITAAEICRFLCEKMQSLKYICKCELGTTVTVKLYSQDTIKKKIILARKKCSLVISLK